MKRINDRLIKNGPFFFAKDVDHEVVTGTERWGVIVAGIDREKTRLTSFHVKNYSGVLNDRTGFSGWRVVGDIPLVSAGGWPSLEEAIEGATQWLISYYCKQIADKMVEAAAIHSALELAITTIKERSTRP